MRESDKYSMHSSYLSLPLPLPLSLPSNCWQVKQATDYKATMETKAASKVKRICLA